MSITEERRREVVKITQGTDWIRGGIVNTLPPVHNSIENVAKLADVLKGYFDMVHADSTGIGAYPYNLMILRKLYVMCKVEVRVMVERTIVLEPIDKMYSGDYSMLSLLENHFFDKPFGNNLLFEESDVHRSSYHATKIILPLRTHNARLDNVIAYWIANIKSLFTTDWSHNELTVSFVKDKLKDQLISALELRKHLPRKRAMKPVIIKIGADPEFEAMTESGTIVRADSLLYNANVHDPIGRDGCGAQIEFRPRPGKPDDLVVELESLFTQFNTRYANASLLISGHTHPLGGHIHIGFGRRVTPTEQLLKMLDDFVGIPTWDLSGTARGSYRRASAQESKPWGFEYRTPPGAIFYNPTLARITLKLVYNIANRYVNIKKDIEYGRPIGHEELVTIGGLTSNEARYYLKKIDQLKKMIRAGTPIEAKWGTNAKHEEKKFSVVFTDEWNALIKDSMTKMLESINSLFKNKERMVTLNLFGFRADRGLVSNIKIPDMELFKGKQVVGEDGVLRIGLPYTFRTDVIVYSRLKDNVVGSIRTLLKGLLSRSLLDKDSWADLVDKNENGDPERRTIETRPIFRGRRRTILELEEEEDDEEIRITDMRMAQQTPQEVIANTQAAVVHPGAFERAPFIEDEVDNSRLEQDGR